MRKYIHYGGESLHFKSENDYIFILQVYFFQNAHVNSK